MNTKQFLVLGLSFALVANVAAMDKETPKQRQQREQKETALRRIAEQKAERAAATKKPATPPVTAPNFNTPAPLAPTAVKQSLVKAVALPINITNDNNAVVVKEPAKKATQPALVPAKPVAPLVEPKGKEELADIEPSVWLRDKAQYLAEYKASIAQYCDSVINSTDDQIAQGIRQSLIDANRTMQAMNQAKESAQTKLQTIEDAYAKDQDFAQLRNQFEALVAIYNLQEQLLNDAHNEDVWALIDATLAGCIAQNQHVTFVRTLTKLKKCFTMAHAIVIESAENIFSEEDATLEAIRQMEELDREEAARTNQEAIRILQEEDDVRREQEANGEAVARLLEEENRPAVDNDAELAQAFANQHNAEQEEMNLIMALSLEGENAPAVDNDAELAQAVADQLAQEEEANLLAILAAQEADNQEPVVDNDAFLAAQVAQQLADQDRAEQDELNLAIARAMQDEWNGQ